MSFQMCVDILKSIFVLIQMEVIQKTVAIGIIIIQPV